jgi:hypothetical protein
MELTWEDSKLNTNTNCAREVEYAGKVTAQTDNLVRLGEVCWKWLHSFHAYSLVGKREKGEIKTNVQIPRYK